MSFLLIRFLIYWYIVSLALADNYNNNYNDNNDNINNNDNDNLYTILGVSKTATTKEIKSAYRRKALDTHPDKNRNGPPEQAAEAFHKVVNAFEILSDVSSRQHYDRTGKKPGKEQQGHTGRYGGGGGGFQSSYTWNFNFKPQNLKDRFEVKEAQSRVMHVVSLEQLRTVLLDDDERLERNLLMAFVTPQTVETIADNIILFPYPFAAMSPQGIWWEDLIQTVKVRFHRENDLTKYFGIEHGDILSQSHKPIFVFGKRGQILSKDFTRLQTDDRTTFEHWMWKQLSLDVTVTNQHDHDIEVYWIHGTTAKLEMTLKPQESYRLTTMLSHEFYARDARVDTMKSSPGRHKLTKNSSIMTWKIIDDQIIDYVIPRRICMDLSGHCSFWNHHGECHKNPGFMKEQCMLTCLFCSADDKQHPTDKENPTESSEQKVHTDEATNGKDEL